MSETHAVRIITLLRASPGGLSHGEVRGVMSELSSGLLRVVVHHMRAGGVLRPSVSQRGGRAPMLQLEEDITPTRHLVALRGASAFLVRRLLAGAVLSSLAQVDAEFRRVRGDEFKEGSKSIYPLKARGVLAPGWPIALAGDVEFSFED